MCAAATDAAVSQQHQMLSDLHAPEITYEIKKAPAKKQGAVIGSAPKLNPEGLLAAARAAEEREQKQRVLVSPAIILSILGSFCAITAMCLSRASRTSANVSMCNSLSCGVVCSTGSQAESKRRKGSLGSVCKSCSSRCRPTDGSARAHAAP